MRLRVVYHGDIYFGAEEREVEPRYFGQNEAKCGVSEPLDRGGGRTRRGRGNRDEGLKVKPEHFGQNEAKNL